MFWQTLPYKISPIAFNIGPLAIRWYSLMYIVGILVIYSLSAYRLKREKHSFSIKEIEDFLTYGILAVLIGGRLGYVLFYAFDYFIAHPLEIFLPFNFSNGMTFVGIYGMSFHGGLIGLILAGLVFCFKRKINVLEFSDFIVLMGPLAYFFGRLGNFFNGELYGRVTTMPWGMYFPLDPHHLFRHPSQLYEAFGEGIILFALMFFISKKVKTKGVLLGFYLIGYGMIRFLLEFFREPDSQIGFVFEFLSLGQVLCSVMVGIGLVWIFYIFSKSSK